MPLTIITGGRKTRECRAGRRRALDQSEQISCWRCENDTGIATSMAVRVILAPRRTPLGRLVPGTEGWICAPIVSRAATSRAIQQISTIRFLPGRRTQLSARRLESARSIHEKIRPVALLVIRIRGIDLRTAQAWRCDSWT